MKKIFLLTLLILGCSFAHAQPTVLDDKYYQTTSITSQLVDDDSAYIIVGDWGRNGHFAQRQVAKWMDIASYQFSAEAIISTGDNFYDNGVASVNDPYWKTSFEDIYHGPHLFIDWYAVLGNHDYRGNWQAQIDYSKVSRRWNMPAQYFDQRIVTNDGAKLHLVYIDTSPLNPDYQGEAKYLATQQQNPQAQLDWLNTTLADNSDADWTVVIGHHPLYSSGKRYGKNAAIRQVIEPILEKYQVDIYFAGHEHDLQHNQPRGKSVAHFVSGGGSEIRPTAQREFTKFAASSAGFAVMSVTVDNIQVEFINDQGQVIYHHALPRKNNDER